MFFSAPLTQKATQKANKSHGNKKYSAQPHQQATEGLGPKDEGSGFRVEAI